MRGKSLMGTKQGMERNKMQGKMNLKSLGKKSIDEKRKLKIKMMREKKLNNKQKQLAAKEAKLRKQ